MKKVYILVMNILILATFATSSAAFAATSKTVAPKEVTINGVAFSRVSTADKAAFAKQHGFTGSSDKMPKWLCEFLNGEYNSNNGSCLLFWAW